MGILLYSFTRLRLIRYRRTRIIRFGLGRDKHDFSCGSKLEFLSYLHRELYLITMVAEFYTTFGSINNPYLKMYSQPFDWGSSGFEPAHL